MKRLFEWLGGWMKWIRRPRSLRHSPRHSNITRHGGFTRRTLKANLRCWRCDRRYVVIFPCKLWHKGHVSVPCACGANVMEALHGADL